MSLSLTNRDDIIADSFSIITANGSVVDILDAIQGSIVGLPPSSLNTIEKLSAAISNDPNYFQTMQTSINTKAPASTTYSKTQVDAVLTLKADMSTTYDKTQVNAFLDARPDDADLDLKAAKSTTYTKTEMTGLLDAKTNDDELTPAVSTLTTSINTKQHKFIIAEIPANTGLLFENNSTQFRAINVETPLSITATRDD